MCRKAIKRYAKIGGAARYLRIGFCDIGEQLEARLDVQKFPPPAVRTSQVEVICCNRCMCAEQDLCVVVDQLFPSLASVIVLLIFMAV